MSIKPSSLSLVRLEAVSAAAIAVRVLFTSANVLLFATVVIKGAPDEGKSEGSLSGK